MPVAPIPGAPPAPQKSQFDLARERAGQRAVADVQKGGDALKRRFAALGGLNSGAAIKAQQNMEQQANQQREASIADIDSAEANQAYQAAEAQKGRDFQTTEAQKGRDFQAGQSDKDRAFQDKVFAFDSSSKLRQLDLADKQFNLAKENSDFEKRKARWEAGQQGGLFGGGGFLGTGIGAKPTDAF